MVTTPDAAEMESPEDFGSDPGAVARRWISEIELAEKDQEAWRQRARKIIQLYRRSRPGEVEAKGRRFALFWSNMETLKPAVLARVPTAVVGRRWKDDDAVGRVASEVLERALNFTLDTVDAADVLLGLRDDFLLVGRGQAWVRYVPHMQTVDPAGDVETLAQDGQVGEGAEPYEVVAWEEAVCDHVSWDDFLHSAARKWAEVRWVARIVYMTRDELTSRFGEGLGRQIPLDHEPGEGSGPEDQAEQWKKAAVYEIWDKPSRKAVWVSKAWPEATLDERDDPLGLQDFFPCPRPLLATTGPDSLIPTPDYLYYEGQCRDIDELTARIGKLTDALKLRGFYAAGDPAGKDLRLLFDKDTNELIPVDSWAQFSERGGVGGLVEWVPLDMVVSTIQGCIQARQQLIEDVWQVTGIADIMRGDVDPDETATATAAKVTWGSSRVRDKQKELARFARDLMRLLGQVIAAKFSPETLTGMTNIQLLPSPEAKTQLQQQLQASAQRAALLAQHAQMMGQPAPVPIPPSGQALAMLQAPSWAEVCGLLRDNTLRAFRIDVESDSTIEPDDQAEKARRIEFLEAVGSYVSKSIPSIQIMPQMLPVIAQGLLFLVRGFRVGREMEETIEKALDQLQQAQGQSQTPGPAPPQKGPGPLAEQAKAQAAGMTAQARLMDAGTRQFEAQTHRMAAQAGATTDQARIAAEDDRTAADRALDLHMQDQDLRAQLRQTVLKGVQRRFLGDMNPAVPIEAPTE